MSVSPKFIIRVYGLLIEQGNVLLVHESYHGKNMLKFPGGGLQYGEGIKDCLIREWKEETGHELTAMEHFYTTDFFQASAFHRQAQLISIYYLVDCPEFKNLQSGKLQADGLTFFWKPLNKLNIEDLTMPVDQLVAKKLLDKHNLT